MRTSTDRILTTHVGSLPRSQAVTDVLFGREHNTISDAAAAAKVITDATVEVVKRQVAAGIDVVSDGEMSKISYATYVADRFTGFDGDTPREPGQDLVDHPRDRQSREVGQIQIRSGVLHAFRPQALPEVCRLTGLARGREAVQVEDH